MGLIKTNPKVIGFGTKSGTINPIAVPTIDPHQIKLENPTKNDSRWFLGISGQRFMHSIHAVTAIQKDAP